jgi:hypothetical protein
MSDLTAIDVLVDPDEATMERARAVNARMLQSLPQGWALDDTHQPHITTLQRYARTADLDQVFQARLAAAVAPFAGSGGTAEAFVADPGEVISPTIIDWVEAYVPAQIGAGKYQPHLTVGAAKFEDLKIIEAEPFDAFTVRPAAVAVYHLGNNGTARQLLKAWPVTGS